MIVLRPFNLNTGSALSRRRRAALNRKASASVFTFVIILIALTRKRFSSREDARHPPSDLLQTHFPMDVRALADPERKKRVAKPRTLEDDACHSSFNRHTNEGPSYARRVEAKVAGKSFDMFVYGAKDGVRDIVSESIASRRAWEREDTERLMQLFPCDDDVADVLDSTNSSKCDASSFNGKRGVLLDVGANVGWFSMVALHLGHSVIAFEPFEKNAELICASKEIATKSHNLHLHRLGLDFKKRHCELFQQRNVNIGDTHSICDEETRRQFSARGYARLGWMNTTTLDDALLEGFFDGIKAPIDVMKIDVEGFEPAVIAGGNQFFESKYAPRYIFMETVSSYMGLAVGLEARGKDYLKVALVHLANHGYDLDASSKSGKASGVSLKTSGLDEVLCAIDAGNILFMREEIVEHN